MVGDGMGLGQGRKARYSAGRILNEVGQADLIAGLIAGQRTW